MNIPTETALRYLAAGLCPLPADRKRKRPLGSWKRYQRERPTEAGTRAAFAGGADAICIVTGAVSGGVECIDFDRGGEAFPDWRREVDKAFGPAFAASLVIETSQSGGVHVYYRAPDIGGNAKLAMTEAGEVLAETRGEGGLVLCAPTEGYAPMQGDLLDVPTITADERTRLLDLARALDRRRDEARPAAPSEAVEPPRPTAPLGRPADGMRPGDDFNRRGGAAFREALAAHGWKPLGTVDGNEHWQRPGKDGEGNSATFNGSTFFVFSSNAAPFEPYRGYSSFSALALLDYNGDHAAAAAALRARGYGGTTGARETDEDEVADALGFMPGGEGDPRIVTHDWDDFVTPEQRPSGHGLDANLRRHLFYPPGFIGEFVNCGMADAIHPNEPLLFLAALVAQAALMGQGFRTPWNCWPNQYVGGVAGTSTGKDAGQALVACLFAILGVTARFGGKPASGAALQDFLLLRSVYLFNSDEAGDLFAAINSKGESKEVSSTALRSMLLDAWSKSGRIMIRRPLKPDPKAAKIPERCHHPQCNFAAWVQPEAFWDRLTVDDLASGLLGRCIVLEGDPLALNLDAPNTNEPSAALLDLGRRILAAGGGKTFTGDAMPAPVIVPADEAAKKRRRELLQHETELRRDYADKGDHGAAAVFGKLYEKAEKLALLFAVGENPEHPRLTTAALDWGWDVSHLTTAALLDRVKGRVARSPHERIQLRILEYLRERGSGAQVTGSMLARALRDVTGRDRNDALDHLVESGELRKREIRNGDRGPATTFYSIP